MIENILELNSVMVLISIYIFFISILLVFIDILERIIRVVVEQYFFDLQSSIDYDFKNL